MKLHIIIILTLIFSYSAVGQVKTCTFRIGLFEDMLVKDDKGRMVRPISQNNVIADATATASNIKTKQIFKSVSIDRTPHFIDIPGGLYKVLIRKVGYKRTLREINVDCSYIDAKGRFSEIVFLHRGNVKELFVDNSVVIGSTTFGPSDFPSPPPKSTPVGPKKVSLGVLNGRATRLVLPVYPPAAKAVRASGAVNVSVYIDEEGNVVSASALSGHPLLRDAAEKAARQSKFSPTLLSGEAVRVSGILVFHFIAH
jgi:TonB family protein